VEWLVCLCLVDNWSDQDWFQVIKKDDGAGYGQGNFFPKWFLRIAGALDLKGN
jgi:hypothetical protein